MRKLLATTAMLTFQAMGLPLAHAEPAAPPHALTRADVREALHLARMGNRVTPDGERGDTPQVLQAREDFNALQAEVRADEAQEAAATAEAPAAPARRD